MTAELENTWTVYYLDYKSGDSWLVQEGIGSVSEALVIRQHYLAEHPDVAQRGQAYVVAPSEPWKRCSGCGQPMVKLNGIPVCVGDNCLQGTKPAERGRIRRTVRALAGGVGEHRSST